MNPPAAEAEKTLQDRVRRIVDRFEKEKGPLEFQGRRDPLDGLIRTILSQNTNDRNRDIAYAALVNRYRDWSEVENADPEELAETIRPAGLNRQKSVRIQAILRWMRENHHDYTLDFLENMTFDEAYSVLGKLKGIGVKTLAVVMCFDLGVDIFPVDTHVHRLCRRLGMVPDDCSAVMAFQAMRARVPPGKSYQFHLHLIRHGRETCHARGPECGTCFIRDECLFYRSGAGEKGR